eukprot:XP_011667260.1 PREDICTED: uncharacterized protein LOC105439689 [Strongylocentrotus purpuratus]
MSCPEKEKLNVGSVQADSITLTWGNTNQATATGFTLVATPESSTPIVRELDLSVLEYIFDGLMSGVEYTVVLYVNGTTITDTVTQTMYKEILSATNIETNQIFVLWSTETEMLDVDFFQMFRLSYSSMVSDSILIPKNAMSTSIGYGHSVTDLVPGDLVTFNLETVTSSGQATLVDTIVRRTKPEMVAMYQVQTDSSTSIRLLWRAPSVGLYRGYLVSYSPADGDQSSPIELGPDEEQLTITGLQFNQMYNVSIRSIMGQEGTYVESDPAFEMVTTGEGEENEVNIRDLTSTSVSFTWWGTGSVESPIGLMPIGSCMAEEPPEQEVTSRAATFDDLMPGARYAISGIGGDNAEFIAVPDQVSNIVVKFINSSAVTFSWTAPSGCYDRIEISYAPDTCTNPSPIVLNQDEGNEYTLTLLQANEEYHLSFVTLQMTARSEPYVASVRTTCPEKEKLNVGSVQADSISLTWGNTTQATATGFTLVATPESSTPIIRELDLSVLEYTFDGLMSGVEYTVVLYVNGTAITDTVTQTTCPSEAQNVTVIFSTQTCLTFTWLPPEGNFHSYKVFVRHGNPPVFVLERTVYPDDDLNVLVENLDASTLYTIGVVTVVDGFKGKPALATQRTTDNLVMTSTVAGDSQAVTVSWQRPDGADYINLVYIPDNGNLNNSDLTNLTDLSVTIRSLTRGKRYVFILYVNGMDGQSALLAQTSYTVRPVRPGISRYMISPTTFAVGIRVHEGVYETYKITTSPSGRTFQGDRAIFLFRDITGLEPDTEYTATVTFKTGDKEAEADYPFQTGPLIKGRLYSDEVTTDSIRLVWGEIPDTDTYAIQLDDRLFFTLQTSYVLTGLKAGTEYSPTLLVRKTGMTELDNLNTAAIYTRPEPVLFFEVKEILDNKVTFVWSGPSSDFDQFNLYTPSTSIAIYRYGKEYTIQVNTNEEFLASISTLAGFTYSEPSTLNVIIDPREPGTIDVEGVTSTSISVTWTKIAGITDYIVNLTLASNNTKLFSKVIRSSLKASFSGLMPGEEYIIKIELQCAGEVLSLRQFTLPLELVCAVFTWVTEDSVTLQWSRPESQLFGYEIMYDDGSGPYSPINVFDRNSLQLERTIMGLMDGPGVEVNITTLAGAGMAQTRSNPVKISPNPREPWTIDVEGVTSTSILVTWTEIAGITDYIANLNLASNNTELFSGVIRSSLKASFSGLMPGEEYIIKIELQCDGEVLSLRQFTLPLEPVCAVFTWVTEDSVTLQWSRPESKLFGYEIMYDDGSGPYSPINVFDSNSVQLERTITGLMDGPGVEVNITTLAGAGMAQTRSNPVKISPSENPICCYEFVGGRWVEVLAFHGDYLGAFGFDLTSTRGGSCCCTPRGGRVSAWLSRGPCTGEGNSVTRQGDCRCLVSRHSPRSRKRGAASTAVQSKKSKKKGTSVTKKKSKKRAVSSPSDAGLLTLFKAFAQQQGWALPSGASAPVSDQAVLGVTPSGVTPPLALPALATRVLPPAALGAPPGEETVVDPWSYPVGPPSGAESVSQVSISSEVSTVKSFAESQSHSQLGVEAKALLEKYLPEGRTYRFRSLPFGLRPAPRVFTRVVAALAAYLRGRGLRLFCYLDDWILLAESESLLLDHLYLLVQTTRELGFLINWEKSNLSPSRVPSFLGAVLDIPCQLARPSRDRILTMSSAARLVLLLRRVRARQWLQFLGYLASLVDLAVDCRLLMRPFQVHLLKFYRPGRDSLSTWIPLPGSHQVCLTSLDRRGLFGSRQAFPGSPAVNFGIDGCLSVGLGRPLQRRYGVGGLVTSAGVASHQRAGVFGSDLCSTSLCHPVCSSVGFDFDGQCNCGGLHKPAGRHPVCSSGPVGRATMELVSSVGHYTDSFFHSRSGEFDSRLPFTRSVSAVGVDAPSGSFPDAPLDLGSVGRRPVCLGVVSSAPEVLLPSSGPGGVGVGCVLPQLGDFSGIRFSSVSLDPSGVVEGQGGSSSGDFGGPQLAQASLVPGVVESARSSSVVTSATSRFSDTTLVGDSPPQSGVLALDCLASVRETARQSGLSERAADFVAGSRRDSTQVVYNSRLSVFFEWCQERGESPKTASLGSIADFLIHLFDKGRALSTIRGYRSAIGAIHTGFSDGSGVSSSPHLCGLLRSFFLKRPPVSQLVPSWSLPKVLEALGKPPFEPMGSSSLHHLTVKTVFLMAIASGEASKEMKEWTKEEVAIWLKSNVHLSDELVSKFEGVDGFTLVRCSKADLREDFELSAGYCKSLMLRREHYLAKERMDMLTTPKSALSDSRDGNYKVSAMESVNTPSPVTVEPAPPPATSADADEPVLQGKSMQKSSSSLPMGNIHVDSGGVEAPAQLNVTHPNQLVREEAQGNVQALLDASSSQISLDQSTGVSADSLERLKTFSESCTPQLNLVKDLKRSIGRDGLYNLNGMTHDSIHFHVKVYTIEGLHRLQSDVQSGHIGHQLGKVLVSEKTRQQFLEDIILDVVLDGSGAWDLLSHAVIDPIPSSTSLSTDFEKREALKKDQTSSSDLMAQQGHPVVQAATVRKQVVNQEEGTSGLPAGSSPLATSGALASFAMIQDKCGPEDAVDKEKESLTSNIEFDLKEICDLLKGEASKEMKDWTDKYVTFWLKNYVRLSDELVSKFEGVNGYTLKWCSKAELIEDFELTAVHCKSLMIRRERYLEQERMGLTTIHVDSRGVDAPGKTQTITAPSLKDIPVSSLKMYQDTVESSVDMETGYGSSYTSATPNTSEVDFPMPPFDHQERQESLYQGSGIGGKDSNSDTERKLTNLLLGSDKGELDSSYYPVLVVNTPAQQFSSAQLEERFGFMSSVRWNVVFDCNADSNKMGLCQYVNQRKSIKILSADKFTETEDVDVLREGIDFPEIPVWLFPNGRNDVNVAGMDKMSDMDWMRERSHAVLNTVRFFSHPGVIPPGRAVVVFFLLSYSDIMVMTQLFKEFYTSKSFQDLKHFTVIAENQGILHKWIQHLESQSIVSSKDMKDRCLGGVPWQEINTYMLRLLGSCETRLPELPKFPRGQCELRKKHQSQWSDISILAKNECENTSMDACNPKFLDFVQEKESLFYQGHEVDWWNFYLSEERSNRGKGYNHVLKRQNYRRLYSDVDKVLNSQGKKVPHICMVTVFHEAGSGGTTVAKNLLWDLHRQYRCAVVNRVTNDTVSQILAFHKYGYEEGQKPGPVVLLLENLDSETMKPFLMSLERETRYLENNGLTFVLIHCKRTSEPQRHQQKEESKPCVCVEQKLTEEEKRWFTKKTKDLEQRNVFNEKKSPERLLAFMVMKKECDPEYLKNVVKGVLPRVGKESKKSLQNAVNLLKYIAVVQKYNPGFAMPVSACDGFMQSRYRVMSSGRQQTFGLWEKDRPPFLNLLLLEEFIQDIDGCVKGLAIVHPVIATEIVEQLGELFQQKPADMILELLEKSTILDTLSYSKGYIQKVCRDLMVKRLKKEYGDDRETDFAPFIEDVYAEDRAKAYKIMEVGIRKFRDPYIAQQKARLHSKQERDFDNAEQAINIALDIVSNNSYFWDTKGIILREKMTLYESREGQEGISDDEMKELLSTFNESCAAFQKAQKVMEEDKGMRNYGGFVGEIATIARFLDIVQKRVWPFYYRNQGLETLRKYLMTEYIPRDLTPPSFLEFNDTMKSLSERVDKVLGRFTDYLSHCAQQRFGGSSYRIYDDKLEKIYTARHRFFALSSPRLEDKRVHAQYPVETAYAMRRSEVKRMNADGYQKIFDMAFKKKVADLKKVQYLLRQNLCSPSLFDIRNFVFTLFALSVYTNEGLDEAEARKSVNILKMMEERDNGFYGLFFEMLLDWPDGTPREGSTPIGETIRQLNARWTGRYCNKGYAESRYNLPRRSRIRQNYSPLKPSTEFYLRLQNKKTQFFHRKSIGRVTYDSWKEDSIKNRLRRLDGVLDSKDRVLYNPDGEEPVKIPLSLPIKGLPSQEPVQFYLGFSFAGPLAYDVMYKDNRETPFIAKESSTNYPSYVNELDDIDEGPVSYDF